MASRWSTACAWIAAAALAACADPVHSRQVDELVLEAVAVGGWVRDRLTPLVPVRIDDIGGAEVQCQLTPVGNRLDNDNPRRALHLRAGGGR